MPKKPLTKKSGTKSPAAAPSSALSPFTPGALSTQGTIREMSAQASLLVVKDAVSMQTASTMLSQLKTLDTEWGSHRTSITKPINESLKRVNALFKPTADALATMTSDLKKKVLDYMEQQEREAAEARKKALAAAATAQAKGDHKAATTFALAAVDASTPLQKTTINDAGQTQLKGVWTFEVEDASEVPREYMEVNEKAITAAIRAGLRDLRKDSSEVEGKDDERLTRAIPGVRIFKTKQLAVSGS